MQIDIQNESRPLTVPSAGLSVLNYSNLPSPDSGVAASLAGTQEGETVAQPLAQEGLYLDNYFSPGVAAQRQAAIAQAGLATTTANQQNAAAQATPGLPLAQRNLQLGTTNAEIGLITPRAQAERASLAASTSGSNITTAQDQAYLNSGGPQKSAAAQVLGAGNQVLAEQNVAATTVPADASNYSDYATDPQTGQPKAYVPPLKRDADYASLVSLHPELGLDPNASENDKITALGNYANTGGAPQAAAIAEAQRARAISIASNPLYSSGPGGTTGGIREGFWNDAGKLAQDKLVATPQQTIRQPDGTDIIVQGYKWEHGGLASPQALAAMNLPPDANDVLRSGTGAILAGRQGTIDNTMSRFDQMQNNRTVNFGTPDNPVNLLPADANATNRAIADFRNRGDVQAVTKILPLIDRALTQINAATDAKTGLVQTDAMLTAARAFRGQVSDTEMRQLSNAGGLQQSFYKAMNILNGSQFDPNTMADLKSSLMSVKQDGNDYLTNRILPDFAKSLPVNARPVAGDLFARIAPIEIGGAGSASASSSGAEPSAAQAPSVPNSIPVLTPQQAAQAPKGTVFQTTDGRTMVR